MICTKCKKDLPEGMFSWKNKPIKRHSTCKPCSRRASQRHYQRNKQIYKDRALKWRRQIRTEIRAAKNVPCADCGKKYPYYVMDFDHLRDKEFNIASWLWSGKGRQQVLTEMKKCDVVCSNCHRIRTHAPLV